jgi:hypothetical protein
MSQRAEIFCDTRRQRESLNKKRIFEIGLQEQDLGSKYFEKSIVQKSCNSLIYNFKIVSLNGRKHEKTA